MTTDQSIIIACPACGTKNRVSLEKAGHGQAPRCGRCKSLLPVGESIRGGGANNPAAGVPFTVTDANFYDVVERSTIPVLVDMWAPWCGPCRMIAPVVEELAGEMAGRVKVVKLNTDENPRTAGRFQIDSIPALLIFKNGREIQRLVGVRPKAEIARALGQVS